MLLNKLTKRFISFNGHSYVQQGPKFIKIGTEKDKVNYYSIIQEYKNLETFHTSLVRNHQKLIINPLLDRGVAKEICSLRDHIQTLQYAAMEHYLEINGEVYKVLKHIDRAAQIRHEHIINLYRSFLKLPKEEFTYLKLKI